MRIGNINICKNVVKGFCIGTGIGVVIGAVPAYLLAKRWFLGHIYYMTEDELEEIGYFDDPVEEVNPIAPDFVYHGRQRNPLQESDDRKVKIISDLIIRDEEYRKNDNLDEKLSKTMLNAALSDEEYFSDEESTVQPIIDHLQAGGSYKATSVEERDGGIVASLEGVTPEDGEPDPVDEDEEEILMNIFDTVDEDEVEATRISEELHDGQPYTISREQFLGSCLDFTKTTIGYYTENHIAIDEEGDPLNEGDLISIIGKDGLNKFGLESDEDDTVYLRNPWIHTDIELVRYWEEYETSR